MTVRVRNATLEDGAVMRSLWRELLETLWKSVPEADVAPSKRSLDWYMGLFRAYVTDSIPGVALVAEEDDMVVGGLLAGGTGERLPWDSAFGHIAHGWGTSVRESYRGRSVASLLYSEAIPMLRDLGFDSYLGAFHCSNAGGQALLRKFGARPIQTSTCISLKEKP